MREKTQNVTGSLQEHARCFHLTCQPLRAKTVLMLHKIASVIVGLLWGLGTSLLLCASLAMTWGTHPPVWAYIVLAMLVALLVGVDDWRRLHPEPRLRENRKEHHALCETCWSAVAGPREPLRTKVHHRAEERCCCCGHGNRDGIHVERARQFSRCDH